MEKIIETVNSIANGEQVVINYSNGKLEQNSRNALKTNLTQALQADLEAVFEDNDNVLVAATEDGLGISVDTPEGTISCIIGLTMKDIYFDLKAVAAEHSAKVDERNKRKAEAAARRAEKMAKDAEVREKKRLEREAKEQA